DGWTSAATIARAAATAGLLAAFAAWEARSSHPMLPLALFRDRAFVGAAAAIMLLFFALTGGGFLLTHIYQFVLGYSPLAAGLRTLPSAAMLAIASPVGARIARRFGTRVPVVAGLTLMTGGLALFATATAGSTYGHYVTAMIILSAGIRLAPAPPSARGGPRPGRASAPRSTTPPATWAASSASPWSAASPPPPTPATSAPSTPPGPPPPPPPGNHWAPLPPSPVVSAGHTAPPCST